MLNKVQLIGFTGADVEIRTTNGGKRHATLRVATSRYAKRDGERTTYTTWHTVEVWNQGTVTWLANRGLPKGSKVYVEGEIRQDRYAGENDETKYFFKIVVAGPQHELKTLDRPEPEEAQDDEG